LTLRRRDGSVLDVAVTDITAGRVVPPSPAQRIDPGELHRIMAAGWRAAETQLLGNWLLRAAGGFTSRANSALAVGDPLMTLEAAVDRVERWYDERGLPPRIQLPGRAAPPALAGLLDARGWASAWPTHVMTAELGPVLRALPPSGPDVRLDDIPDESWLAACRPDEGRSGTSESVVRALLTNHPDVGFASIREDGHCTAIARAAVDGRWVGLFCVEVLADRRRTGLATMVSAAALRWAVGRGARRAYLQVTVENSAAQNLYQRLGFTVHHDYVYRSLDVTSQL
jgi:ribosomal protein S18 acetylase RimI-like enzyme